MKKMRKFLALGLVLCMALGGCGKEDAEVTDSQVENTMAPDVESVGSPETGDAVADDADISADDSIGGMANSAADDESETPLDEEDFDYSEWLAEMEEYEQNVARERAERREVFLQVLRDMMENQVWPDGSEVYFDSDMTENQFALFDLDGDEKEELLITYTTTAMAGMREIVYDYDLETQELREQFVGFPYVIYYANGVVYQPHSHNHTDSVNFWPCTLYLYDPIADTYSTIGTAIAWDKEVRPEDFPEDVDFDGDGTVYAISYDEDYPEHFVSDNVDFEAWYSTWITEDDYEYDIPWHPLEQASLDIYWGEEADSQSVQAQLELMVDSVDQWMLPMDYANEVYEYAVTDLDGNGRLEIIAANMGGTGLYTYSNFYEVNETYDGLTLCERDVTEGESQADIGTESVQAYYDSETGTVYYVFADYIKNGAAEYYEVKIAVSLTDGKISEETLAIRSEIYDPENGLIISCQDSDGAEITEDEFGTIADTVFDGLEKREIQFGWCVYQGTDGMEAFRGLEREEMLEVLSESYESFVTFEYFGF